MPSFELFDAYYYAHDCGRPYRRDESWLSFFDNIAKRIIGEFQPKTVLDAGCAWGFLVEAFRRRGVMAYGVDISEYAIQNVHPDVKPYCRVGSVTEPFEENYDLITCIEVLEHVMPADAEKAIENLCAHSKAVIFSSTPFDYKEATHFNVHEPEYWSAQFARCGFYHELDVELSYITPWAMMFVKADLSKIRLIYNYEHKLWQLRKENADLRQLSLEMQNRLKESDRKLSDQDREINDLRAQLHSIQQSRAWKVALLLRNVWKRFRT